jgi:uracil-DNA glycosylase
MSLDNLMENIHECWKPVFINHYESIKKILEIYDIIDEIYPPKELIFRVFKINISDIKLVLLGQDSYHGKNQANGLAFSVNTDIKIPPSLKNIYKEIKNCYPEEDYEFSHGNLERWFNEEKIFLFNCSLCVFEGKPGSFINKWELFTNDIIKLIAENNKNAIFLLLGNFAKEKLNIINNIDKCITCVHPSPLSANRGFIGSKIFLKVDEKLSEGLKINWSL